MDLQQYFSQNKGIGVLSTADRQGVTDAALYAAPRVQPGNVCVFLMADQRSYRNVRENPRATYLFLQQTGHYQGVRLYMTKTKESQNEAELTALQEQKSGCPSCDERNVYAVSFAVDTIRPLIGEAAHAHGRSGHCPTCRQQTGTGGHLCVPVTGQDEQCRWCGAVVADQRHLCSDKVKELTYICNSCGRTAVKAEYLCQPRKI